MNSSMVMIDCYFSFRKDNLYVTKLYITLHFVELSKCGGIRCKRINGLKFNGIFKKRVDYTYRILFMIDKVGTKELPILHDSQPFC